MDIVQNHRDSVLGEDDILLYKMRALRMSEGLCRQRVLRQITACSAMGDCDRLRKGVAYDCAGEQEGEQSSR